MTYRMVRTSPTYDELPLVFGSLADLEAAARVHGPGRYHVDEFAAAGEVLSTGHTSREWGVIIHQPDGTIVSKPCQWPEQGNIQLKR
jgi:hypothetical protein